MKLQVGDFEVDVWTHGAPVWTSIRFGNSAISGISEEGLLDLQYAVSRALREIEIEERRRPK